MDNGLAVTQLMGDINGNTTLVTVLTHSSGQYIASEFIMEKAILSGGAGKNPAQAMGASITYMRRYAYAAIIGLAQEDDDAANAREQRRQSREHAVIKVHEISAQVAACLDKSALTTLWKTLPLNAKNDGDVIKLFTDRNAELQIAPITDAQRKAIMAHYKDMDRTGRLADMSSFFQREITSAKDLTKDMASELIDAFNGGTEEE